jgi:hypothetical protein
MQLALQGVSRAAVRWRAGGLALASPRPLLAERQGRRRGPRLGLCPGNQGRKPQLRLPTRGGDQRRSSGLPGGTKAAGCRFAYRAVG